MQNKSSTETQTPQLQRNAESVAIDGAEVVAQRGAWQRTSRAALS